jgi:nuclear pore complex protein Nup98-Nup96
MSISAMPAYNTKSFEELRWEDCQAGVKGGTGSPAPSPAPATPPMGAPPFGLAPAASPFGRTPGAFGSHPSIFGAAPSAATAPNAFGTPGAVPFGEQTAGVFGPTAGAGFFLYTHGGPQ